MRNSDFDTRKLTFMAFGIALNIIGAFIALTLRLPIYMDSIGTIMIAMLLGPKYAVITGVCGSLISGTFDVYSLYYAPVQISTGLLAGLAAKKGLLKGAKTPLGVLCFAVPTSIISAIITVVLFDGITSSGSSYLVQILSGLGMNKVLSAFIVQVVTDYTDKFIAVALVILGINAMPKKMMASFCKNKNYMKIETK